MLLIVTAEKVHETLESDGSIAFEECWPAKLFAAQSRHEFKCLRASDPKRGKHFALI